MLRFIERRARAQHEAWSHCTVWGNRPVGRVPPEGSWVTRPPSTCQQGCPVGLRSPAPGPCWRSPSVQAWAAVTCPRWQSWHLGRVSRVWGAWLLVPAADSRVFPRIHPTRLPSLIQAVTSHRGAISIANWVALGTLCSSLETPENGDAVPAPRFQIPCTGVGPGCWL